MQRCQTLDLDPEMGDVEFIEDIEKVFGIRLAQADVGDWLTLEDVAHTLRVKVSTSEREGACATLLAFNRIRRSLPLDRRAVRRDAELAKLAGSRPRDFFGDLQRCSGLRMPAPILTNVGSAAVPLLILSFLALVFAPAIGGWKIAASSLFGLGLSLLWVLKLDPGQMPPRICTIGDLARWAARMNLALLRSEGARHANDDVWQSLTFVAADHSAIDPAEMTPDMFLFRKTAERTRRRPA